MFNSTNIDVTSPRQFVGTQGKTKEYNKDETNTATYTEADTNGNYVATTKMAWIADADGDAVAAAGNIFHPAIAEVGTVVDD